MAILTKLLFLKAKGGSNILIFQAPIRTTLSILLQYVIPGIR